MMTSGSLWSGNVLEVRLNLSLSNPLCMKPTMSSSAPSLFGRLSSIATTQGRLPVARHDLQFVHNHGILEPTLAGYAKSDIVQYESPDVVTEPVRVEVTLRLARGGG